MDEEESSSWKTPFLSLFGNSSTQQQGDKKSADNCESSSSAEARTSQRFNDHHVGSSQNIVEPVRPNSGRSIASRNECDVYEAPPQRRSSQPGANNNAFGGTGDIMRRRLNSLNASQRNAKVNPDTNEKFHSAEAAVNDSNNVQNKGIQNRNRNQWTKNQGKTNCPNNDRKPNIFHGGDNKHPQGTVGGQGNASSNGNRNERRGNSGQGDIARRRFTNLVDTSLSNGKPIQKQQFRNTGASDRPENSNSNTALNVGQSNRNRNQGSESHGRNTGGGSGNGNFHRRNDNNQPTFFGFKKFENYLKMEADSVVLSLHKDIDSFEAFLKEAKAYEGNLFNMLLAVLSEKVFSDESNLVSYQNDFVKLLGSADIINRFRDKCMTLEESKLKFMYNIADFMKRRMPVSAADSLTGVVSFCIARLSMIENHPETAVLLDQFKNLFQSFHEKRQHEEVEAKARKAPNRGKFTDYDLKSFDKLKPPDDFRDICIIPSVEELLSTEPSFLRPNKQSGSYTNAEHYLDVQFRLLREDFLQPLKKGIQEFLAMRQTTKNPKMPKGSPIRLYYNVKCLTAEVKNENLHYWIQLHTDCAKIQWDKSRRLLPGNLVLLAKNSPTFDSVVFATIGLRKDDDLKKHRKLTIIPENATSTSCNVDVLCDDTDLLLIESEVYWESFRHVLKTAQSLDLSTFSLAKYIVRACTDVRPPPSILEPNGMIASPITLVSEWRRYTVDPLICRTWPGAEALGLDSNQFEAFKAALTKQFSIIQGPPGTGKTFVGLRIAEVILQNPQLRTGRKEHPNGLGIYSEYRGPLLCICYTNHALDQFLEGILDIMDTHDMNPKIVRVGGRSKSERLSEFNLRDIARRITWRAEGLHWKEIRDVEEKMKQNQNSIKHYKQIASELERPTGIVKFETLSNTVYQTLCFEFSTQLLDKLSSPSFYKLTQNDVSNTKENRVTEIVRKWFVYLNLKANKKAKAAPVIDPPEVPETVADIEEYYDMEELMEHRMITDPDNLSEIKIRLDLENCVSKFHVDNMSILQSKYLLKEYEKCMQKNAINDSDPLNVVYAKQRNVAQVRENDFVEQKRLAILSEIFRCLNEKLVQIPDVTKELESLRRFNTMDPNNVVDRTLPYVAQRYASYLIVAKRAKQLIHEIIREIEKEMIERVGIVGQLRRQHEVQILKDADVVGMTTTGAAKFNDLLVKMKSRIVIVEEAAEVLEAHIVTSLTKYTDHLILIGDHKQLKPSTAVYDLSRKYDLDVSLFERMINNNMTCYSLLAQHRMRPEIADLIRGSIYDNLNDAPNVLGYDSITGMTKDLFFLSHSKFEKSEGDSLSKLNEFEADFLAGLAGYLLKQGYPPSSITVLTTYTGQMFILKSKFRHSESLQPIKITCVDNFQGEENEIILLSLVRSNADGKMGFLSVSNRVCVALSRAKKGMYVVGNMTMLSKQTIWSDINTKLEKRGEIGPVMKVVCQSHKTQSDIATGEDFINKCPEGGCSKMCGILMNCSHYCPRFCHPKDLNHEEYQCRELCRKPCLSLQAHPCRLQCHFGKVCMPCNVPVPKPRSCGHDISISCHKSAEEGFCQTQVKRLLKCDHEVNVACSQIMDDWKCREILDKILTCSHESKLMCHVNPDEYQCKIEVKKKLPCSHYRNMKCFEEPVSSMCKTFVEKQLPCGHDETIECRFDPKEAICTLKVTVSMDCGHSIVVPCFRNKKGKIVCVELCEERLSCGHSCPLKCHYSKDRHHEKFRCKKLCAKKCPEGHPCVTNHECSSQCKKCVTIVERKLPECGHIAKMYCFESLANYRCRCQCGKVLDCGHSCRKKCSEPCDSCKEMTTKQVPTCLHDQQVQCDENAVPENCKEKVKIEKTLCGHEITVSCSMKNLSPEEIQTRCTQPCDFMFPAKNGCEHKCSGSCGACLMGSLHQKCKEKCSRPLICAHLCAFPCSKNCPPCKERCQMKCEHSKCNKMCGDDCFICKERCNWNCKHKRCTKLCGEMCNRGACDEPCNKKLRCGHLCIGFCSEKCPPLCRICNLDKLTEFQLLYTENEDDARFIWLPDCNHTIEVEGLTMHFNATDERGEVGFKKCPRCTTVITTLSGRFGNIIRKTFQDVAEVKKRFYGNREQNQRFAEEIQHNLRLEENNLENYLPSVKNFFEKILYFEGRPNSESSPMKLRPLDINSLNSLQQIWVWVKEIMKNMRDYSDDSIRKTSHLVFRNITDRQLPLSAFEIDNISNEIQRLAHLIQFYRRWNSASNVSKIGAEAKTLYGKIVDVLTSKGFYDEKTQHNVVDDLKNLEKLLKTGMGISDLERIEIVKALNMKQGHWFKCPNGHLYAIGECGGAMETAKCNECGAAIGGGNHALLATNQFAPEMDGAIRPAWDNVMVPQNFGF